MIIAYSENEESNGKGEGFLHPDLRPPPHALQRHSIEEPALKMKFVCCYRMSAVGLLSLLFVFSICTTNVKYLVRIAQISTE